MNIFKVFQNRSKSFYFFVIFLGIVNSILFSGILIFINNKLSNTDLPIFAEYEGLIFISLLLVSITVSKIFQTYLIRLTNQITFDFEVSILKKLRSATYETFENLGAQRVYTVINDTRSLGQIPESLVNVLNSSIIIICGLGYLFWVSPKGALTILAVMVILLLVYLFRNKQIEKDLNILRDLQDSFHVYVRDLLLGFKEVKMSSVRGNSIFHSFLKRNRSESKAINMSTSVKYLDNELMGNYSWYVVLGVILFLMPKFLGLEMGQVSAFVVTVLYLMGPVSVLITTLPYYTRVKIAIERITSLEKEIKETVKDEVGSSSLSSDTFESLQFENVVFDYNGDKGSFVLGPINLKVEKGDLVFLTGGNGSGKSTFINLLTGLYKPKAGNIYLNGQRLSDDDYVTYRDQISAIFTDNYLFNENYDSFVLNKENKDLTGLIDFMKLEGILSIKDNNIDNSLSKGQKKRLALIYSLLEKKEVMVLDEWAAEQDPEFRRYFYKVILPKLINEGKTIVAVTHDDNYFSAAHRIIKFDFGQIVSDTHSHQITEEKILVSDE